MLCRNPLLLALAPAILAGCLPPADPREAPAFDAEGAAHYAAAVRAEGERRFGDALRHYSLALRSFPGAPAVHLDLGRLLTSLAPEPYRPAEPHPSPPGPARRARGPCDTSPAANARYRRAARRHLLKAFSLGSSSFLACAAASRHFLALGRTREALRARERAVLHHARPPRPRTLLRWADELARSLQGGGARGLARALALRRAAARSFPGNLEAQEACARLLLRAGLPAEALPCLQQSLRLAPERVDLVLLLGDLYLQIEQPAKARWMYRRGLEMARARRDRALAARIEEKLAALDRKSEP